MTVGRAAVLHAGSSDSRTVTPSIQKQEKNQASLSQLANSCLAFRRKNVAVRQPTRLKGEGEASECATDVLLIIGVFKKHVSDV